MVMRLVEKINHTTLKVSLAELPSCKDIIAAYLALYGGCEMKRSSRFVYYEINANLLNKKKV